MVRESVLRKHLQRADLQEKTLFAFVEEAGRLEPNFGAAAARAMAYASSKELRPEYLQAARQQLTNLALAAETARKVSDHANANSAFAKKLYYSFYGRKPKNVSFGSTVFGFNFFVPQSELNFLVFRPDLAGFTGEVIKPVSSFGDPTLKKRMRLARESFERLFGVNIDYLGGICSVVSDKARVYHEARHGLSLILSAHSFRPEVRSSRSILDSRNARVGSGSGALSPFTSLDSEITAFWSSAAPVVGIANDLLHPVYQSLHPARLANLDALQTVLNLAGKRHFAKQADFRSRVGDLLARSASIYGVQLPFSEEVRQGSLSAAQLAELRSRVTVLIEKEKKPLKSELIKRLIKIRNLRRESGRSDYFVQSLLRGPYVPRGERASVRTNDLLIKHLDRTIDALRLYVKEKNAEPKKAVAPKEQVT